MGGGGGSGSDPRGRGGKGGGPLSLSLSLCSLSLYRRSMDHLCIVLRQDRKTENLFSFATPDPSSALLPAQRIPFACSERVCQSPSPRHVLKIFFQHEIRHLVGTPGWEVNSMPTPPCRSRSLLQNVACFTLNGWMEK